MPTLESEVFKFSKIPEVELTEFEVQKSVGKTSLTEIEKLLAQLNYSPIQELIDIGAVVVITSDGKVSDIIDRSNSTIVCQSSAGSLPIEVTDKRLEETASYFDLLHGSLIEDLLYVSCPKNSNIDKPVVIVHLVRAEKSFIAPLVVVKAGENSAIRVCEVFISEVNDSFVIPVTLINLEKSSRVSHFRYQLLSLQNIFVALQLSEQDENSQLSSLYLSVGSKIGRMRIDSVLNGAGSEARLASVGHGRFDQKLDLRTKQDHIGQRSISRMTSAIVLGGNAESVTTGLVKMRKGAKRSEAIQSNKNLLVSSGANAESVPNLDILENDVRCDHASSVGPIDLDQVHYLESRGVETRTAKKLIIKGFLNSTLESLPSSSETRVAGALIQGLPD